PAAPRRPAGAAALPLIEWSSVPRLLPRINATARLVSTPAVGGSLRRFSTALVRRLRDEGGATLIMGLGILMTLTVMVTGTLQVSAESGRSASYSNAGQTAYTLAEAGLNNAVSVL